MGKREWDPQMTVCAQSAEEQPVNHLGRHGLGLKQKDQHFEDSQDKDKKEVLKKVFQSEKF